MRARFWAIVEAAKTVASTNSHTAQGAIQETRPTPGRRPENHGDTTIWVNGLRTTATTPRALPREDRPRQRPARLFSDLAQRG